MWRGPTSGSLKRKNWTCQCALLKFYLDHSPKDWGNFNWYPHQKDEISSTNKIYWWQEPFLEEEWLVRLDNDNLSPYGVSFFLPGACNTNQPVPGFVTGLKNAGPRITTSLWHGGGSFQRLSLELSGFCSPEAWPFNLNEIKLISSPFYFTFDLNTTKYNKRCLNRCNSLQKAFFEASPSICVFRSWVWFLFAKTFLHNDTFFQYLLPTYCVL